MELVDENDEEPSPHSPHVTRAGPSLSDSHESHGLGSQQQAKRNEKSVTSHKKSSGSVPAAASAEAAPVVKRIKITRLPNQHDVGTLLAAAGMLELEEAFINQDIFSVEEAARLEQGELREILERHSFVASIGLLRRLAKLFHEGHFQSRFDHILLTPDSVVSRCMLQMQPRNLKECLNERFNAETIFATLMFGAAATMLVETPDEETCLKHYQQYICETLRCSYVVSWGLASAFFSIATLVSLGSVSLFFGHASLSTIHSRFVGAERYVGLSFLYISLGLLLGLLPGSCINLYLRFPEFAVPCGVVSTAHWLLWLQQLIRGASAIGDVYSDFPGFEGIWQFVKGYVCATTLQVDLRHADWKTGLSCAHSMEV